MNGTVDSFTTVNFSSNNYQFVGGNGSWTGFVPAGQNTISTPNKGSPVNDSSPDLLLTPEVNGQDAGTVNTTANSGGIGSGQDVNGTDTFRIDFVTDLLGNPADTVGGANYSDPLNRDHMFDGHYTTNGASAVFSATGNAGATVHIAAKDDSDHEGGTIPIEYNVGDGQADTINKVVISYNGETHTFLDPSSLNSGEEVSFTFGQGTAGPGDDRAMTVRFNGDGTIDVANVYGDSGGNPTVTTTVAVYTGSGYNSVEYSVGDFDGNGTPEGSFKIGGFGTAVQSSDPVSFSLPIEIVDGDGDTAASAIGVTLTAPGTGLQDHSADAAGGSYAATASQPDVIGSNYNDTITGNDSANVLEGRAGDDTLTGGAGNDTLIGGAGNDTLTGGAGSDWLYGGSGADHFKFTAPTEGLDHILDFNMAESDTIDILASAFGGGLTAGTDASAPGMFGSDATDNFASGAERFHFNTATHTLLYSADGSSGSAVQLAVLENGGTIDQSHIHIV
jgi:Ca2+-binding RTX toxin-like protein